MGWCGLSDVVVMVKTELITIVIAREASRRIVDDILITAGAVPEESLEDSPSMVQMNHDILDDTF